MATSIDTTKTTTDSSANTKSTTSTTDTSANTSTTTTTVDSSSANTASTTTVTPAVQVVKAAPVASTVQTFQQKIDTIKASGSEEERTVVAQIENYISNMAIGVPQDEQKCGRQQMALWRLINIIGNYEGIKFNKGWGLLLDYFFENKDGALSERGVYRGAKYINLSSDDLNLFHAYLNLLLVTCEVKSRSNASKQINFAKLTKSASITPKMSSNIISFYKV